MTTPESTGDRPGLVAWRMIEAYSEAVSIYDGASTFLNGFEKVPIPARHLLAVRWCDYEVCNGGFHQFFHNSTGVLAPEALEGFRTIGLNECADLLEAAMSKFGKLYPRDRAARQTSLRLLQRPGKQREESDPFYDLDERYHAAKKQSQFHRRLDDYARTAAM